MNVLIVKDESVLAKVYLHHWGMGTDAFAMDTILKNKFKKINK